MAAPPEVNKTLNSTSTGVIQDHFGAVGRSTYMNNVLVGWQIDLSGFSSTGRVKFNFPFFHLDPFDYVIIYDGKAFLYCNFM